MVFRQGFVPYGVLLRQHQEAQKLKEVLETNVSGTVKWFSLRYHYGFIARDDGTGDVFVHQMNIVKSRMNRIYLRSLASNEKVEFDIVQGRLGPEAANVTGPNDTPVQGVYVIQLRSPAYQNTYNRGNRNGNRGDVDGRNDTRENSGRGGNRRSNESRGDSDGRNDNRETSRRNANRVSNGSRGDSDGRNTNRNSSGRNTNRSDSTGEENSRPKNRRNGGGRRPRENRPRPTAEIHVSKTDEKLADDKLNDLINDISSAVKKVDAIEAPPSGKTKAEDTNVGTATNAVQTEKRSVDLEKLLGKVDTEKQDGIVKKVVEKLENATVEKQESDAEKTTVEDVKKNESCSV